MYVYLTLITQYISVYISNLHRGSVFFINKESAVKMLELYGLVNHLGARLRKVLLKYVTVCKVFQ